MPKGNNRNIEERRVIAECKAHVFFVARELLRKDVTEPEKFALMKRLGSTIDRELEEYRNPA